VPSKPFLLHQNRLKKINSYWETNRRFNFASIFKDTSNTEWKEQLSELILTILNILAVLSFSSVPSALSEALLLPWWQHQTQLWHSACYQILKLTDNIKKYSTKENTNRERPRRIDLLSFWAALDVTCCADVLAKFLPLQYETERKEPKYDILKIVYISN
jgi:hypothetical protein